jgi:hypothetical protein
MFLDMFLDLGGAERLSGSVGSSVGQVNLNWVNLRELGM